MSQASSPNTYSSPFLMTQDPTSVLGLRIVKNGPMYIGDSVGIYKKEREEVVPSQAWLQD